MQIAVIISEDLHLRALSSAQQRAAPAGTGLFAPLPDDSARWFERLWDGMRDALLASVRGGLEMARPQIQYFEAKLEEARKSVQDRLDAIVAQLIERLNIYLREVMNGALSRVEESINVGPKKLEVQSVTLQQSIKLSSSLSISLTSVCQLIGEGQLIISAQYGGE
jgi:hypothetical protein